MNFEKKIILLRYFFCVEIALPQILDLRAYFIMKNLIVNSF